MHLCQFCYRYNIFVKRRIPTVCFAHTRINPLTWDTLLIAINKVNKCITYKGTFSKIECLFLCLNLFRGKNAKSNGDLILITWTNKFAIKAHYIRSDPVYIFYNVDKKKFQFLQKKCPFLSFFCKHYYVFLSPLSFFFFLNFFWVFGQKK